MKIDINTMSNTYLLHSIKVLSFGMFCSGLVCGTALVMTGVASKQNEFENVIFLALSSVLFLFLSLWFYYRIIKVLLPEIGNRLKDEKKI